MTYTLRDGSQVLDPRLDRIPRFDERSRRFPVTAGIEDKPLRSYSWNKTLWLDQGREGACVGFSLAHELAARPATVEGLTDQWARETYWEIQRRDPWAGGAYPGASPFYEGTDVLTGAQLLTELGYYTEYRWGFGEHDLALGVGYKGPAVLGIPWYEGMFHPDENGYVWPTGQLAGYHAILCPAHSASAINPDGSRRRYRLDNTWGQPWGGGPGLPPGSCWVTADAMANVLLPNQGEALIPVKRHLPWAA